MFSAPCSSSSTRSQVPSLAQVDAPPDRVPGRELTRQIRPQATSPERPPDRVPRAACHFIATPPRRARSGLSGSIPGRHLLTQQACARHEPNTGEISVLGGAAEPVAVRVQPVRVGTADVDRLLRAVEVATVEVVD